MRRFGSVAELEEYIGEGWENEMPPEAEMRRFGSVAELEEYIGEGWENEMPPEAEREACGGRRQPAGVRGGGQPTITTR